jgi:hypothetical protein
MGVRETYDPAAGTYTRWAPDGSVVESRPLTAKEVAGFTRDSNALTLRDRLRLALTSNATYLAIPAPTAADVRVQTERLTRQVNALVRLALQDLDVTD